MLFIKNCWASSFITESVISFCKVLFLQWSSVDSLYLLRPAILYRFLLLIPFEDQICFIFILSVKYWWNILSFSCLERCFPLGSGSLWRMSMIYFFVTIDETSDKIYTVTRIVDETKAEVNLVFWHVVSFY